MLEKLIRDADLSPALASKLAEDYERLAEGNSGIERIVVTDSPEEAVARS